MLQNCLIIDVTGVSLIRGAVVMPWLIDRCWPSAMPSSSSCHPPPSTLFMMLTLRLMLTLFIHSQPKVHTIQSNFRLIIFIPINMVATST